MTYFNPRSHCRERLGVVVDPTTAGVFQSTFPLQGTTTDEFASCGIVLGISIHVPIAGNDGRRRKSTERTYYFNPRSHCRERRSRKFVRWKADRYFNPRSHCRERPPENKKKAEDYIEFQSTFPLQGTTVNSLWRPLTKVDFNPRSHCRERPQESSRGHLDEGISIHVPIAGNDGSMNLLSRL